MKKSLLIVLVSVALIFSGSAWAGKIEIKGSTTVLPIAQKIEAAYKSVNPDVSINLSGGGSSNGIKALIDGMTDIANASRFIKGKEVKHAVEKDIYPVPFRVAYDCIVPVVHPSNPVNNITKAQLKDIYMGKIKNWKDLGGKDTSIVVISRDSSSGTFDCWKSVVMEKERVIPSALTVPSNGGLVQAVSTTEGALGYIALGYVDKSIKTLTVNGIKGSASTTLDGSYPISRPLFMFTNGWPEGDTLKLINYILSPAGQKVVESAGSIPVF